jgi:hypothetical protein
VDRTEVEERRVVADVRRRARAGQGRCRFAEGKVLARLGVEATIIEVRKPYRGVVLRVADGGLGAAVGETRLSRVS